VRGGCRAKLNLNLRNLRLLKNAPKLRPQAQPLPTLKTRAAHRLMIIMHLSSSSSPSPPAAHCTTTARQVHRKRKLLLVLTLSVDPEWDFGFGQTACQARGVGQQGKKRW
jgi:hypothetical protein